MTHSALHRIAAGWVAALYLLGGAQHWLVVDPCPHHDSAFFAAGIVDAGDSAHHAHHGGTPDASESEGEEHGPCGCVGPCATPSPTALPSSATYAIASAVEHVESSPIRPRDLVAPQFVPYLLPYAHAPPSLG